MSYKLGLTVYITRPNSISQKTLNNLNKRAQYHNIAAKRELAAKTIITLWNIKNLPQTFSSFWTDELSNEFRQNVKATLRQHRTALAEVMKTKHLYFL